MRERTGRRGGVTARWRVRRDGETVSNRDKTRRDGTRENKNTAARSETEEEKTNGCHSLTSSYYVGAAVPSRRFLGTAVTFDLLSCHSSSGGLLRGFSFIN